MVATLGRSRTLAAAALTLLGACTADLGDATVPDEVIDPAVAAKYDFGCWKQSLPDRAEDLIRVDGFANDSYTGGGLGGVMVEMFSIDDGALLDARASDDTGLLSFDIASGNAPVDVFARMRRDGHVTSYLYPSRPLVADQQNVFFPVLPPEWRAMLADYAGVELDASKGIVAVIVTDCAGARVEGATVTFDPPADAVAYWDLTFTDASATTTRLNGHAWGFNVPAGVVDATVTIGGATYRDWPVRSFADGRTMSWRAP
jgi:hypothetical protein